MRHLRMILFLLTLGLLACGGAPAAPTAAPAEPTTAAAVQPAAPAADGDLKTFVIVSDASEAAYVVNEEFFEDALSKLGINPGEVVVRGVTPGVSGALTLNMADLPASPLGTITVDLTGLQTDQNQRDRWLQNDRSGPRFSAFPTATFVAKTASGLPATVADGETVAFQLSGDMTVRDVTRPVTFDVTAQISGAQLTGTARANLLISDFGIAPPNFLRTLTVADPFVVEVALTAAAQ